MSNNTSISKLVAARLVVVEDDAHLLKGIRDILELEGYEVVTASNGVEGLELLDGLKLSPDLIVSDIMMPRMGGYEFYKAVRASDEWLEVPFIFLTAKGEKDDVRKGKRMGVDDYVVKPMDPEDLLIAVKNKLDQVGRWRRILDLQVGGVKSQILAMLNHEFRTPLTIVVGYADMLEQDAGAAPPEETRSYLRSLKSGADRLSRLVEGFITLVELRTGEARQNYEWRRQQLTDLDFLLKQVEEAQEAFAAEKGVTLELKVPGQIPSIEVDPEYLRTALIQLVNNGIKFTDKPGEVVELSARVQDSALQLCVRDDGRGIPSEEVGKIWDPLYQIDRERYEDQGAGAGLSIVAGIIGMHGGKIKTQSQLGEGTTITISLPLAKESMAEVDDSTPEEDKVKLVVVEDDTHLLKGIQDTLELDNYEVETATDGLEGLDLLENLPSSPDLIISDIMMPRMGGYEFYKSVRATEKWIEVPFIFLTAKGEKDDIRKGKSMGVDDYVVKPMDAEDLLIVVRNKLAQTARWRRFLNRQVEDVQHDILTMLNHEFRTPLTYVVAYADMLDRDDGTLTVEEIKNYLRGLNAGADRLRQLIESFITLIELKTGKARKNYQAGRKQLLEVDSILQEVAHNQAIFAEEKNVTLKFESLGEIPPFMADPKYLGMALMQLVNNGIKFSDKPDPVVELTAMVQDSALQFQVRDYGRGIPEEYQDKIWDPLYQIDRKQFEDQGAGAGLPIVRGIIEDLHGGEIDAESTYGEGTTITIRLPLNGAPESN